MLDLNLTNSEKTYVHLVLRITSKVTDYDTTEDIVVKTLDTLVLDKDGDIKKDVLYSDLDQLLCGNQ